MTESFMICDPAQYRAEYGRLASILGRPGAEPAPGEVEFLESVTTRGRWTFGMLAGAEIFFAAAIASILAPDLAIEIGTASGFSAAILAKIISLRHSAEGRNSVGPLVHTIDKRSIYQNEPLKPIGFAIDLMTPELHGRVRLHLEHDSSYCREISKTGEMIGFVDGNHRHPWPLCDILQICRLIRRGWILMHDIDLPQVVERARAEGRQVDSGPASGAKHVFDLWPEKKIRSGNIGAIRVPDRRGSLKDFISKMRTLPGEVSPISWIRRWETIDEIIAPNLVRRAFSWTNLIWRRRSQSRQS